MERSITRAEFSQVVTAAAALGVVLLAPWLMASYGKGFTVGSRVLVLAAAAAVVSAPRGPDCVRPDPHRLSPRRRVRPSPPA